MFFMCTNLHYYYLQMYGDLQIMNQVVQNLTTPTLVNPTPEPNHVFNVYKGSAFFTTVFAQSSTPQASSTEFK